MIHHIMIEAYHKTQLIFVPFCSNIQTVSCYFSNTCKCYKNSEKIENKSNKKGIVNVFLPFSRSQSVCKETSIWGRGLNEGLYFFKLGVVLVSYKLEQYGLTGCHCRTHVPKPLIRGRQKHEHSSLFSLRT